MTAQSVSYSTMQSSLVRSRYDAILKTADMSVISPKVFEQLYFLNASGVSTSDPRTALLTSVSCAIQDERDFQARPESEKIYANFFEWARGKLDDLLALELLLHSLDLLQCTALIELIKETFILSKDEEYYGCALDLAYDSMTASHHTFEI